MGAKRGLGKTYIWLKSLSLGTLCIRKIEQEAKDEKGMRKVAKSETEELRGAIGGISWEVGIAKIAPPTENRQNELQE